MNTILTMLDVARAREFYATRLSGGVTTLYSILAGWAAETPDRIFLRDTNTASELSRCAQLGGCIRRRSYMARVCATGIAFRSGCPAGSRRRSSSSPVRGWATCATPRCTATTPRRIIVSLLERAGSAAFVGQTGYGADASKNDVFSMLGGLPKLKKVYRLDPLAADVRDHDASRGFGPPFAAR